VDARQLRADLGAEAIIGINVVTPQGVPTLEKLDIDYVTIAPGNIARGSEKQLLTCSLC